MADSIMMFAREGETDPKILKQLALAALPRIIDAYPTWAEELAVRGLNATRAWGTFRLSAPGLPNRAPGFPRLRVDVSTVSKNARKLRGTECGLALAGE